MTNSISSLQLGICEIFHPKLHGLTNNSSPTICTQYIIHRTFFLSEFWDMSYQEYIEQLLEHYHYNFYYHRRGSIIYHPIIRNYHNILNNVNHYKLDIIQVIELSGNEQVACIKTIWLKLLQRRWKKIYKERITKIKRLKNLYILQRRELTGQS